MEENLNQTVNETVKTKSKLPLILIVAAIVLVLVVGGVFGFMMISKNPKKIFKRTVTSVAKELTETLEEESKKEVNSLKYELALSGELNLNEEALEDLGVNAEIIEQVEQYLDGSKVVIGQDIDLDQEVINTNLGLTVQNENLINGNLLIQEDSIYALVDGIIDEYIIVEEENAEMEEMWSTVKEALEEVSKENSVDPKAIEEIGKAIAEALDEQEFEQEKEEIKIDGKTKKVTKSTLVIKEKEAFKITLATMKSLKENDKFFEYLGKDLKNEVKDAIDEAVSSLEETAEDDDYEFDDETEIEISIYTKGITNKFVGIAVEIDDGYTKGNVQLIKTADKTYEFTMDVEDVELSGKFSETTTELKVKAVDSEISLKLTNDVKEDKDDKKEGKLTLELSAIVENVDYGNVKLVCEYKTELNGKVEKVDVTNAVYPDDMTEEEVLEIQNNLLESPLYKFLEEEELLSELGIGDITTDPVIDQTTTTADNVLNGYGYNVTFSTIPEFATSEYNTDTIKFFDSPDYTTSITAELSWNTVDEELSFYEEYYKESTIYENVVVAPRETITVGDKTYTVLKITFDSLGEKETDIIYCCSLGDEYLYVVEYEFTGEETYDIKPFLTINVAETEE